MADAFVLATTAAVVALAGGCAAGWTGNHTTDIAASWVEGCEQLSVWRVAARVRIATTVAAVWLGISLAVTGAWLGPLGVVLPAHGLHRKAGVA